MRQAGEVDALAWRILVVGKSRSGRHIVFAAAALVVGVSVGFSCSLGQSQRARGWGFKSGLNC